MSKLKVGDRVMFTSNDTNIPLNSVGRVTLVEKNYILVDFDMIGAWEVLEEELEADGEPFYCLKDYWYFEPILQENSQYDPDGLEPSVFAVDDTEFDLVNKPKHYQLLPGVEVRDVIKVLVSKIANKGILTEMQISDYVQMMQYLLRFMEKGGVEDIKKAKVYLEWILEDAIKEDQED